MPADDDDKVNPPYAKKLAARRNALTQPRCGATGEWRIEEKMKPAQKRRAARERAARVEK
ncbi:hypothetical protein [Paraburkholderia sp. J41]|uniref:hypothetical protein n=1 Tax=Paraburkholderia sp. J41 TaxID=2805433 RepID=UPI002AC331A0|nr:hypothetical protein [Paraburkholderia sp. J41]